MKRLFIILCFSVSCFHSSAQKNNLDYFVNQALANSPLLKEYESQLSSLTLDSKIFLAGLKPQVNGISNNSFYLVTE